MPTLNAYLVGKSREWRLRVHLLPTPKVLLCDEATSALDPKITGEILELLKEINEKRKLTIVIITHEMSVVEKICDRVAIIDNGKLAEIGEVKEVFRAPQSKAARKLVFPTNPFDPSNPNGRLVRIVFDGLVASEPFIANLVETTGKKVNILSANTKSVGGIGYGQMVLELPPEVDDQEVIIDFLKKNGLSLSEVVRE
ncbi:NIL domain-containing protein [Streptococcus gallolyticus]|uniref:NIL domain-containing protein n=1 Tax=Streptococcus gallolyticus TaxID=315405 RepID=UPI00210EB014|nr:NIL domain-containing protein [Streptococcus gallolyticus]